MSVAMNSVCYLCILNKISAFAQAHGDDATATAFVKDVMQVFLDIPEDTNSSSLSPFLAPLYKKHYGLEGDRFRQEKIESNEFVLERLPQIRQKVASAADPLFAALQFSILGNYIDFSALHGEVSFEKLDEMLESALDMKIDRGSYESLLEDLRKGRKLLYITDNAGEIGFDRVLAEQLHKAYPHLAITFMVRGGPANNDATREDAETVGIPFPVIDNGNLVPGTDLSLLSAPAKAALEEADVILAKGQGNVETMFGCGYNVYYAFLVKCSRFIQLFDQPKLTPMLLKERK